MGGKTYAYYLCATHKDSKQCSSHRISTNKLEEVVLELLQTHIDNMIDLKRILSFIGNVPFQQLDMKKLEERREKKQAEVDRCADLRGMLYEDMKDGIISKEDYKELHTAYGQRKKSDEIAIHQIELEMEDVLNRKSKFRSFKSCSCNRYISIHTNFYHIILPINKLSDICNLCIYSISFLIRL